MRWFYVPNEHTEGDQVGPRMAFEKLHAEGVFSAYMAYSYLVERQKASSHSDALDAFVEAARAFEPDVIFAQHINFTYPVDRAFMRRLKNLPSGPRLVVHEGDPYNRRRKTIDATLAATFAEADIVVLVGLGTLADLALEAGARKIRFTTHSYDSRRFGDEWKPTNCRKWDAVMIANCSYFKRIPGLYLPGGRQRKQSAEALYRVLGDRFAVFGKGQAWAGKPYARGMLPFNQQGKAVRDAWMSVNWHHFDEISLYSSDRLPISLACGVPHITNWQEGYRHIFDNIPGCFIVHTPREMRDVALYLLSQPIERRIELGLKAAEYARREFDATVTYRDLVFALREDLFIESPSSPYDSAL